MFDYDVQRCSRRCSKTDRELQPGELYYSVLIDAGSELKRLDFAASAWEQPPEGTVAWWKAQMPGAGAKRMQWAPHDALLQYFEALEQQPEQEELRYVLALLLVRRRIVRWEHSEPDEHQREIMVLYCPRQEQEYRVPVPNVGAERVNELQQNLVRLISVPAAA
jgi:hypothetical protein